MFNFKVSGIAAGSAFVLSLIVGIVSGSGFAAVLFRAAFFAALFFLLFCLIFWIVGQFMPELLSPADNDLDLVPGSRIDLTASGPIEGAFPRGNAEDVDNIEEGKAGSAQAYQGSGGGYGGFGPSQPGMDQGDQSGYTKEGGQSGFSGLQGAASGAGASGEDPGLMPDFDVLSGSFSNSPAAGMDEAVFEPPPEPRSPPSSGGRKNDMMGDFNPKELAQAIQTVLKKDDKG